jgi:hypothetical protein
MLSYRSSRPHRTWMCVHVSPVFGLPRVGRDFMMDRSLVQGVISTRFLVSALQLTLDWKMLVDLIRTRGIRTEFRGELLWIRPWTFGFCKWEGISSPDERLSASQEGLCSMKFTYTYRCISAYRGRPAPIFDSTNALIDILTQIISF